MVAYSEVAVDNIADADEMEKVVAIVDNWGAVEGGAVQMFAVVCEYSDQL